MSINVSIVIPVYNAERYLATCIESLLTQSIKEECEFIFVNDGSIDKSKYIIEQYKNDYDQIILINQENQGVSSARNAAIEVAKGEYIGFVDADDYVRKEMFETLYNAAKFNNSDVIVSNFENEIEGTRNIICYPFPENVLLDKDFIEKTVLPYFIKTDDLNTVVTKLYKKSIIKENNIKFPEKIALGEDGFFNMQFFLFASNMEYINYTGYHYREVAGSATRNILEKDYFIRSLEVYNNLFPKEIVQIVGSNKIDKLRAIKLINSVMSYCYIYFLPFNGLSYQIRYNYVKQMIKNKNVIEAVKIYEKECMEELNRYETVIFKLIKSKSTIGLYIATTYSRYRNKNWGVI